MSTTLSASLAKRIETLCQLQEGWDSYGARKPDRRTLEFAANFAVETDLVLRTQGIDAPLPLLVPAVDGGAQLEWECQDRELEIEISAPNKFLFYRASSEAEEEGKVVREEAVEMVRWLANGAYEKEI